MVIFYQSLQESLPNAQYPICKSAWSKYSRVAISPQPLPQKVGPGCGYSTQSWSYIGVVVPRKWPFCYPTRAPKGGCGV